MRRTFKLLSFLFIPLTIHACGNSSSFLDAEPQDGVEISTTSVKQPVLGGVTAKGELNAIHTQQAAMDFNHYAENTLANLNHILEEGDKAGISETDPNEITVDGLAKVLGFIYATDIQFQEAALDWQLQLLAFQSQDYGDWSSLHQQLQNLTRASQGFKSLLVKDLASLGITVSATDWDEGLFTDVQQVLYGLVAHKFQGMESQEDIETQLVKEAVKRLLKASTLSLGGQAFQVTAHFTGSAFFQLGTVTLRSADAISLRAAIGGDEQLQALEASLSREMQAAETTLQDLNVQFRLSSDQGLRDRLAEDIFSLHVKLDALSRLVSNVAQATIR